LGFLIALSSTLLRVDAIGNWLSPRGGVRFPDRADGFAILELPRGKMGFVTSQEGLKLHAREWGPRATPALPVVCLPGLARTLADFEPLALAINSKMQRRVLELDSRGRGRSQYDRNPAK
jgi:hypothetical protein